MKVQPELTDQPITPWVAYTPTFTGYGTVSGVNIKSRRNGPNLEIRGHFQTGTATAVEGRMSLGFNGTDGNVTSSSSVLSASTEQVGSFITNIGSATAGWILADQTQGYVGFSYPGSGVNLLSKMTGPNSIGSNVRASVCISIPIQGWQ